MQSRQSSLCNQLQLGVQQLHVLNNARIPFSPPQPWKTSFPPLPLPHHAHSSFTLPQTTWSNGHQSRGPWLPSSPL